MTVRTAALPDDLLTRAHRVSKPPCVSIHVPVAAAGFDRDEDRIRLRNLVTEARGRLAAQEHDDAVLGDLPDLDLRALTRDARARAVLLFRSPEIEENALLPHPVAPRAVVGRAFSVRPLIRWTQQAQRFWLLVLDASEVALFDGNRSDLRAVDVPDLPADRAEALWSDDPEETLQYHSGTTDRGQTRGAMFHGHGADADTQKTDLLRFFRRVDDAVAPVLKQDRRPLVLACVDYYRPLYEEADSSGLGVTAVVPGSPHETDRDALHRAALDALGDREDDDDGNPVLARYRGLASTQPELVSDEVLEVLEGAREGRVETLLVPADASCWGVLQDDGGVDLRQAPEAEDVLDLIVRESANTGASIHVLEDADLGAPAAAIWRYARA